MATGQRAVKEVSEKDRRERFQEEEEADEAARQERTWCRWRSVRGVAGGAGLHPCGGAGRGFEVRVSTLLYLLFMTRDLCLGRGGDGIGV